VSRNHSHINTAEKIIGAYTGEIPLSSFIKNYFSHEKKFGSNDRRQISHLCYSFFRLGKSLLNLSVEEKILTGLFLCSGQPNPVLEELRPDWNKDISLDLDKKTEIAAHGFSVNNIFPWKDALSEGIDHEKFARSFLIQPDLFLRLRPGHEASVKKKLDQAAISYRHVDDQCLSLANTTKLEEIIDVDKEAVIQDLNSRRTGELMKVAIEQLDPAFSAWDCCAASGGKSLLLHDLAPSANLTVSDVRESIIANLKKRFARAGVKNFRSFVGDVSLIKPKEKYDLIICDAPCTGSGAWSRTPEQLYFFKEEKIEHYSALQKKICDAAMPSLKQNGFFLYITCSVFKEENEQVIDHILARNKMTVVKMELLKGYDMRADNLFGALMGANEG
jgi:16S rRNA (cytosine967-C5)-methyltransferase